MTKAHVKLDHVTFVAALTACSHIGLVDEGLNILKSMETVYGVPTRMENYACAIDLLGRAGRLMEAKELINEMQFEPDEMATKAAERLLELDPGDHCTYVLVSDMYGHLKRWDEKAGVKKLMREKGVKKVPGSSWIELQNEAHAFNADDRSHPNCREIYQALEELNNEISSENSFLLDDLDLANGFWVVDAEGTVQAVQI